MGQGGTLGWGGTLSQRFTPIAAPVAKGKIGCEMANPDLRDFYFYFALIDKSGLGNTG